MNEPAVIHQAIDGELVIIHLEHGLYYSLDSTGARIWSALATGESPAQVIAALARNLDAPETAVAAAVESLVEQLCAEELMVLDGAAGRAPQERAFEAAHGGVAGSATALNGSGTFSTPVLQRYDDLQDLLLLDPIHAVDESGWPDRREGG